MDLTQQIESLLFIAGRSLTYKKLAETIGGVKTAEVKKATEELAALYQKEERGLRVVVASDKAQLASAPELSELTQSFAKEEMQGELTKPSVETLAIIAYRGPVAKLELERIRGVNCSLILRNLLLRGLVEARRDSKKREDYYSVSLEFLKHLGVSSAKELPDYEKLRYNEDIDKFLAGSPINY